MHSSPISRLQRVGLYKTSEKGTLQYARELAKHSLSSTETITFSRRIEVVSKTSVNYRDETGGNCLQRIIWAYPGVMKHFLIAGS